MADSVCGGAVLGAESTFWQVRVHLLADISGEPPCVQQIVEMDQFLGLLA